MLSEENFRFIGSPLFVTKYQDFLRVHPGLTVEKSYFPLVKDGDNVCCKNAHKKITTLQRWSTVTRINENLSSFSFPLNRF